MWSDTAHDCDYPVDTPVAALRKYWTCSGCLVQYEVHINSAFRYNVNHGYGYREDGRKYWKKPEYRTQQPQIVFSTKGNRVHLDYKYLPCGRDDMDEQGRLFELPVDGLDNDRDHLDTSSYRG